MANLDAPEKKELIKKVAVSKSVKALEQTPPDLIVPLQLKVKSTTKNEFKALASMRGKPMNVFFEELIEEYKINNS